MDRRSAIFIIVSIAILVIMLYLIGINNIINALKHANITLIAAAIAIQFCTYFLYTLRWNIINKSANIHVSFKSLFPIMMVGLAVNNITPSGRGGGEPVRAYILSREKDYDLKDTFATVVADRMLDTFPFIVLAAITTVAMLLYMSIPTWLVVVLIVSVVGILAVLAVLIYLCINPNFGYRLEGFIYRIINRFYKKASENLKDTVHENIFGFQKTMRMLMSDKKVLYITIPLSFVIWISEILRVYVVFLAFGATLNVIIIGEVFILASLVGMIPLLPGGLGATDGLMIGLYSKAGASTSLVAPVTMIERLISFWMATIIGLMILPHYGSSVLENRSISSSAEQLDKSISDED